MTNHLSLKKQILILNNARELWRHCSANGQQNSKYEYSLEYFYALANDNVDNEMMHTVALKVLWTFPLHIEVLNYFSQIIIINLLASLFISNEIYHGKYNFK